MYAFSDWVISLFEKNGIVLKHNRSTYVYGLDIFLYTILSTVGLLLIGYVSHHFYESVLLIILFYTNQTYGGGFHASSHTKCFLTMTLGLGVYLLSFLIKVPPFVSVLIAALSFLFLYVHPLVLHKNKSFLASKSKLLVQKSRCILSLEMMLFITLLLFKNEYYLQIFSIALLLCALSRKTSILLSQGQEYRQ